MVDIFQDNHIVKHKYMRAFITIVPVMFYVKHKIIYAVDRASIKAFYHGRLLNFIHYLREVSLPYLNESINKKLTLE